jgi:tetratricopeptide (TPR) repeat protein
MTAGPSAAALGIAKAIRFQLTTDERCQSVRRRARVPEAADLVCAAMVENRRNIQGGDRDNSLMLANAQRAVELDPELPDAYYHLSLALGNRATSGSPTASEDRRAAKAAALAGLALAPNDPALVYRVGLVELFYDWNLRSARANLERAIALDPNGGGPYRLLGQLALREGNVKEALEHFRRTIRIDDANAGVYGELALVLLVDRKYDAAIQAADASLKLLVPTAAERIPPLFWKIYSQHELGDLVASNATLEELLHLAPVPLGSTVLLLARAGRIDEARRMLAELERQPNPRPDDLAVAYLSFDIDRTFEWLNKGVDARTLPNTINTLRVGRAWDPLRQDPRWDALMLKLARVESGSSDAP